MAESALGVTAPAAVRAGPPKQAYPPADPDRRLGGVDRRPSIPDTSPRLRAPAEPSARVRAGAASRSGCRAAVARLTASDPTQAVSGAPKASPARARKCRCLRAPRTREGG